MLQIGLLTVIASSEAVTTQVYCVWVPSRSPMIVGSAVETIVVLTIATKSADISPMRTSTISLWVISACCGRVPTVVVSDMGSPCWCDWWVRAGRTERSSTIAVARSISSRSQWSSRSARASAHGLARLDEPLAALRGDRDQLGAAVLGVGAPR